MRAGLAPRRGSFFETWRLLSPSAVGAWLLPLTIFVALLGIVIPFTALERKSIAFAPCAVVLALWFAIATVMFEFRMGRQLAFMAIVPQPVDTRRLILVPMYALAFPVAFITAAVARLPAVAALVLIGIAWWTTASARWSKKLPFWLELPVLLASAVGAELARRLGGWGTAAVVAMLSGVVAFAFQPRVFIASTASPSPAPRVAPIAQGAVSRPGGRAVWLKSAVAFLLVSTASMRRFNIIMFTVATLFTVARTIPGQAFFFWLLVQNGLFEAYSRETFDFVRTRPFGGAQRFVGGVLIPLLVSLVVPTLMTAIVDLDRINNVSIFGWFLKVDDPHADLLRYLRKTLGATFLPEKWPAAGLTDEMWLRVRPLVWLDLLRMTTIIVATRFAQGRVRGVGLETVSLVISIVPMFATLPGMIGGPAAPLWFTALLAAIAIALWGWCERAANRFGVATDTSSSG